MATEIFGYGTGPAMAAVAKPKPKPTKTPEERYRAAMADPAQAALMVVTKMLVTDNPCGWAELFMTMMNCSDYSFDQYPATPEQAKEWLDAGRAFFQLKNK